MFPNGKKEQALLFGFKKISHFRQLGGNDKRIISAPVNLMLTSLREPNLRGKAVEHSYNEKR